MVKLIKNMTKKSIHSLNYYKLSPDAFSRYFLIFKIISRIYGKQQIKILDVGGTGNFLWQIIEDKDYPYELTVLDILEPPYEERKHYNFVKGDATKSPFKNEEFDVVVTTDVLEHIPESKKKIFITETLRVAKELIIIAAPFQSSLTDYAERLANDFFKKHSGKDHPWLKEHFKFKKPKKEIVEKILKIKNYPYIFFESNNLENWLLTILPNFLAVNKKVDIEKVQKFNLLFNKNLFDIGDFFPPAYRQFYVIFKNKNLKNYFSFSFNTAKLDIKKKIELIYNLFDLFKETSKEELIKEILKLKIKQFENQNKHLEKEIKETKENIRRLEKTLNKIKSAKFFKLWQAYCSIMKFLGLKKNT